MVFLHGCIKRAIGQIVDMISLTLKLNLLTLVGFDMEKPITKKRQSSLKIKLKNNIAISPTKLTIQYLTIFLFKIS